MNKFQASVKILVFDSFATKTIFAAKYEFTNTSQQGLDRFTLSSEIWGTTCQITATPDKHKNHSLFMANKKKA